MRYRVPSFLTRLATALGLRNADNFGMITPSSTADELTLMQAGCIPEFPVVWATNANGILLGFVHPQTGITIYFPNNTTFNNQPSYAGQLIQYFSGCSRVLTPIGGGHIREFLDLTGSVLVTNAAQGAPGALLNVPAYSNIYVGMMVTGSASIPASTYVAAYNVATGVVTLSAPTTAAVPSGATLTFNFACGSIEICNTYNYNMLTGITDIADMVWVEKWADAGGIFELWSAPTTAAGAVPNLTKVYSFDSLNGVLEIPGKFKVSSAGIQDLSKSVVATASLTAATLTAGKNYFTGIAGPSFALTLPAAAVAIDGLIVTVISVNARPSTTWASTGASFVGAPAALVAATPVNLQYDHATLSWYIC